VILTKQVLVPVLVVLVRLPGVQVRLPGVQVHAEVLLHLVQKELLGMIFPVIITA